MGLGEKASQCAMEASCWAGLGGGVDGWTRGWSSHAGSMQAYFGRRKGNRKKRNSQIHAPSPMHPLQTAEYFWARRRQVPSVLPSTHPPTLVLIMGKQRQGEKKKGKMAKPKNGNEG